MEGGFDRAVGFVNVVAISKPAGREMRVKIPKEQGNISGRDVKKIKLAHPGHIADKAPVVERDQFRVGRGVRALVAYPAEGKPCLCEFAITDFQL